MKKTVFLLLAIVVCLFLTACTGNDEADADNANVNASTSESNDEKFPEWEKHEDGYYVISKEELATYLTETEITTENWQDFFSVKEIVKYNAFGEVEESYNSYGLYLPCWVSDDFAVELTDGNKSIITEGSGFTVDNWNLSEITCLRAQGKITVADVPEELWQICDGEECFAYKDIIETENAGRWIATCTVRKSKKDCTGYYDEFSNLANAQ